VEHYRDASRTVCDVVTSLGKGEGGIIETIRLSAAGGSDDFAARIVGDALKQNAGVAGIVAVHLLRGRPADSSDESAGKALRSQPYEVADWILLIEAVDPESVRAARRAEASTAVLERCGVAPGCCRGLYRLQFGLVHSI
jgi:hypothetical protein